LSNGCNDCVALIGEHFEHRSWHDEAATLADFQITISGRWRKAIDHQVEDAYGWGVFAFE
jgi:hypothetical protein